MPTHNVNLTPHFDRFIAARVTSGRFGNASEVVREGLRLLEQRDEEDKAKLKWLRDAVGQGSDEIHRGEKTEFDSIKEMTRFIDELGEDAETRFKTKKHRPTIQDKS